MAKKNRSQKQKYNNLNPTAQEVSLRQNGNNRVGGSIKNPIVIVKKDMVHPIKNFVKIDEEKKQKAKGNKKTKPCGKS